ncbi:Tn3 family transposase [Pandoraea sp. NPDC090278]|uniref:Tn3 family transposase n=1 Tax=Pandoraea sp. NPDC090278 TaxID=3364391 RepID=UPI00383B3532
MASIERTAYPRFPRTLTLRDLQTSFTPGPEEIEWALGFARTPDRRLALLVMLKCFQFLRRFPTVEAIPADIVEHISATLGIAPVPQITYPSAHTALYRHHKAIRTLLGVKAYTDAHTREIATDIARRAADMVVTRVDIINIAAQELVRLGHELPAFGALDEIAERAHAEAELALYSRIAQRLSPDQRQWLDQLLEADLPARRTLYHQIKRSAQKASRKHLELVLGQLYWLESLPDSDVLLSDIPTTKLQHLAQRAAALDAGEMKDFRPDKRHTLILAMFQMAKTLRFVAATQDGSLLRALDVVLCHEGRRAEWIAEDVDLSFASERWRKLVRRSPALGNPTNRRHLEVCVFSYLCSELRCGDICIEGSGSFADYREQLLPWSECEVLLPEYCERIGVPADGRNFVDSIKTLLADTAAEVDDEFPQHAGDLSISSSGEPTLRRVTAREIPPSAIALQAAIDSRIVPRNLLDILANIEHWSGFTRNFGPLSGDEPKLRNARERYLLNVFAMGCNLGPNQAARHLANGVTPHQLSYVNQRHMSLEQLDNACRELTELYLRLDLPKLWGEGTKVAADGTQYNFYEQNLLVGMHFRYRRMGAVAYRHVADNYIAVFRHFIPPGVLEAVYVIEGLLKAGLSVQADTVYSDTHGQSETDFAFTYLNGIQLMPRIRNWKDLRFYKADKNTCYKHIDRIFNDTIDWNIIRNHWKDLMQVAISIQAGRIASPMLLRKLSHQGRHNRLFAAARELGRALRTIYLLRWISQKEMRQEVTATTNKIESYHAFAKWLDFGGDVIASNDLNEQQKRVRYIDLVASAVILQNTVDMMRILQELHDAGEPVSDVDVSFMSPYGTGGVKRFGNYHLDLKRPPEPWVKESLFRKALKLARALQCSTTV